MGRGAWGGNCTFGEAAGVAVHLQGVQGPHLQLGVVVEELLHDGLEGQQQHLLLLQLLLGGRRQLVVALCDAQLQGDVLEEAARRRIFVMTCNDLLDKYSFTCLHAWPIDCNVSPTPAG